MKNITFFLNVLLVAAFVLVSCKKNKSIKNDEVSVTNPPGFVIGKNRFTTQVDGDTREYYVHVPVGYNSSTATPVVFMLHGSFGDGEKFYNISGWKEVGEAENFLTVIPSAWQYSVIDNGVQKTTTKWSVQPADWYPCIGENLRNDVKFLNTIISDLKARFNVDSKRICLVGFSNGGQMAAKCSIEMSDKFAAIVESSGSFYLDTTYIPLRKMPITVQVGNKDPGPEIPLSQLATMLTTPGTAYYKTANAHIKSFGLNPNFTISCDTNTMWMTTYSGLTSDSNNVFRFVLIKGFGHLYPNGSNHPMKAAEVNWEWMKNYTLP